MDTSPLLSDDQGREIPFETNVWVSATRTRNYIANDGLVILKIKFIVSLRMVGFLREE